MNNEKDKKTNITFLIGAGAECNEPFNIINGNNFKIEVLFCKNVAEIYKKINNNNEIKVTSDKILTGNSTNVFYQTLIENPEFKKIFLNNKEIIDYVNYKSNQNENKEKDDKEIKYANFKRQYNELIIKHLDENKNDIVKQFLDNVSPYSYIDSYFNYLRKPKSYIKEASKVVKLYFSAYLSIVSKLGIDIKFLEKLDTNKKLNRVMIKEKISSSIKLIINNVKTIEEDNKNNNIENTIYYLLIKEICNTYNVNIITTNYLPFVDEILDINKNNIVHIHGQIDLFENLYTKEIKSITEFDEQDIIFPYLMVQSGVKPIISPYQIKEWYKAVDFIENSDYVIVLGYGMNSDDEHITTILRTYAKFKKYIFFLHSTEQDDKQKKEDYNKQIKKIKDLFNDSIKNHLFYRSSELKIVLEKICKNEKELKSSLEFDDK